MRSSNPAFSDRLFAENQSRVVGDGVMTVDGAVNKSGILIFLAFASAGVSWMSLFSGDIATTQTLTMGGFIAGFILALVTIFKQSWSPYTAPAYAIAEGFALGGITAFLEAQLAGIAFQAVTLTFGALLTMFMIYRSGLIVVNERFRSIMMMAIGAICITYMVNILMSFFGMRLPFLHDGGPIGIGIGLVIAGVAAFSLLLDFDLMEQGAQHGLPKYMEWYAAFGLMVTLVWLYLEIIRLLAIIRGDD